MSIFAKPVETQNDNQYKMKILFLHGLEGSPTGSKARHLQASWGAMAPHIRTTNLRNIREKCSGQWHLLEKDEISEALAEAYSDAADAVRYSNPDLIVGSSMGGAILFKLYAEEKYSGPGVFLAPAITHLLDKEEVSKGIEAVNSCPTSWILGETDTIVSNTDNISIATACNGNVMFSPGDGHRLSNATDSGLLDSALVTVIEISQKKKMYGG